MDGWYLRKIISGGQTGVDRAALDAALERGIPCGGWCPKGRLAEDGAIPEHYPMHECDSAGYSERTRLNVYDSDVTLVLFAHRMGMGTRHTLNMASDLRRPVLTVDLDADPDPADALAWFASFDKGLIVNVAGPRESTSPGIYPRALDYLRRLLRDIPFHHDLDELPRL